MENEKNNRKVKYTKMVLRQSILELMKDKNINKISVKDICEKADINRGTFYAHYSSPYDLLEKIEDELIIIISETLADYRGGEEKTEKSTFNVIYRIIDCITENIDICKVLLSENGDAEFLKKILYIAKERCISEWEKTLNCEDKSLLENLFSFVSNGSIGIIQRWIKDSMLENPKDIAVIIDLMVNYGLSAFFKNEN